MSLIARYYEKKGLMDKLSKEIKELEENTVLKAELKFKSELLAVIKKHNRTLDDAFKALVTEDPLLPKSGARTKRKSEARARPTQVYNNPHTGEVVETRGANHKKLREWRLAHGSEEVSSWRVQ